MPVPVSPDPGPRSGRQAGPPRDLLVIGGNVAVDFVNTVDDPGGPAHYDHIGTWHDLLAWATRVELVTAGEARHLTEVTTPPDRAELVEQVLRLRDILVALFVGHLDHEPHVTRHWRRLRPFLADAVAHSGVDATTGTPVQLTWARDTAPSAILHPITFTAADLLRSTDLRLLKRCAQCHWLFLDRSKNHSRRWCSMDDCGTAVKVQRYVARRAARRRDQERPPG